jgi:hypothetical protein
VGQDCILRADLQSALGQAQSACPTKDMLPRLVAQAIRLCGPPQMSKLQLAD